MLGWIGAVAWAAAPPTVELRRSGPTTSLRVVAPAGQKVEPAAPSTIDLSWGENHFRWESDGTALVDGVPLPDVSGQQVEGTLAVGLCDADGSVCRPTTWTVMGVVPESRRFAVGLDVRAPEAHASSPFGAHATEDQAAAAFGEATRSGKAVLLDFSAAWCPPCNQFAAEILHAEPRPPELDGYAVAVLDADHESSWRLKSRYEVGGYPTIVITDAAGAEKTRMVGYPGLEPMLAWLAGGATSTTATDLLADPAGSSPERAAELGLVLLDRGDRDGARRWVERASVSDSVDALRLSFGVEPDAEALEALLQRAPDRATSYVMAALELREAHPELVERVLDAALRQAKGTELADLASIAADLATDAAIKRTLASVGVGALRGQLTGDWVADKAQLTFLATLLADAGDVDGALQLLADASAAFPDEPTYELARAGLFKKLERNDDWLAAAELALQRSWGDNRLRAVASKADALVKLGRVDEAKAIAAAELAAQAAPEAGVEVRTHKYRERLQKIVDGG